jgi:hypothetical protein
MHKHMRDIDAEDKIERDKLLQKPLDRPKAVARADWKAVPKAQPVLKM